MAPLWSCFNSFDVKIVVKVAGAETREAQTGLKEPSQDVQRHAYSCIAAKRKE
jgi:NACalpha-BTF3-like transcription factor